MTERPAALPSWFRLPRTPRDWPAGYKCALASAASILFFAIHWGVGEVLAARHDLAPYHAWARVEPIQAGFGVATGLWTAWLALSLALRRRRPGPRWLAIATVQLYAATYAATALAFGLLSSPYGVVLVGSALVGLLVFDWPLVAAGGATSVSLVAAATVAETAGRLPYAPMFQSSPMGQQGVAPFWRVHMAGILVSGAVLIFAIAALLLLQLRRREERLEELVARDPLTDLLNRRHLMQALRAEVDRATRYRTPLSCIMIDLDHFKRVNDRHGHQAGDRALLCVSEVLRSGLRTVDVAGRYGGEEFCVLLPQTSLAGARVVAERLRQRIERAEVTAAGGSLRVTASFGLAERASDATGNSDDLVKAADDALLRAKQAGRNTVVA